MIPRALAALALAGSVSCSAASPGAPTASSLAQTPTATATIESRTLVVGDLERSYRLVEPPNVAGPMPLLIALHPFRGRPESLMLSSRFADLAATDGVLVAFPAGVSESWNAGTCCGDAVIQGIDDVAFIRGLIEALEAEYPVDPGRVFVTGFSNGGMLAYRVGCELSDLITAIGVVAGARMTDCQLATPVSLIALHGTSDNSVPFDGGEGARGIDYPSVLEAVEGWAQADGCAAQPTTEESQEATRTAWSDCADGSRVLLIAATNQGHFWFFPEPDASVELWTFFNGLGP
ncbi:MAG: alpha/beta hydrolase family esterase [Candidatus Limnocylindria bacterium]